MIITIAIIKMNHIIFTYIFIDKYNFNKEKKK